MSTISFTKQALSVLGREKPHSSITDLIEILTSPSYEDEAFDGIPELVESINLQPTGPAEASRAIRKKLKHGDSRRQYRALVLLKATVENGGHKYQTTFADEQLIDAIKHLVTDPTTDPKVKRKLISVLGAWHQQFQGDPKMSSVSNLYKSVPHAVTGKGPQLTGGETEYEKRRREEREAKEEAKRKAKQAKEDKRKKEEEARLRQARKNRPPFNFEKEKPQILQTIAEASQAANNLVNALTLVNPEHELVQDNVKVKECLETAKTIRKRIVRYIQLVENEELIGTLLETNERIIASLQMYDKLIIPDKTDADIAEAQQHLATVKLTSNNTGEIDQLQERQRAAVERHRSRSTQESPPNSAGLHPDLQELSFGDIGSPQRYLPPPIRPDTRGSDEDNNEIYNERRGSLSDFSDYESSDEESHARQSSSRPTSYSGASSSRQRPYAADSLDDLNSNAGTRQKSIDQEDPFADPFADQQEVSATGTIQKQRVGW